MKKVLLISMPFGALDRPALGVSLLKAQLAQRGFDCDILYPCFALAELIGAEDYRWISTELPYPAYAGDWAFSRCLYGDRPEADAAYINEVLCATWGLVDSDIARILHIRSLVPHFLDNCMQTIDWSSYGIVGFTSTFEQNLASLALAARLSRANPEITVVFGGANWEAVMGLELHRRFHFVDYVCSGEADETFPALVEQLLSAVPIDEFADQLAGIVYRSNGDSIYTGPPRLVRNLDALPFPDFSDYFEIVEKSTVGASVVPSLLVETSRGCWWGKKSQCTFCGLNGGTLAFRSKSAGRALAEIQELVERWRIEYVEVVDNVLDMKYFDDLLPALAECFNPPLQIFYEVRPNLSRRQIELLAAAGVRRIQPGIESLSDHVLKLMRKGTTALRNVQLLKWCREYGVGVHWNLLYGFPGETRQDYEEMLDLLPSIRFLDPPGSYGPVRLDRFSPYFESAAGCGFVNVRPFASYDFIYPFGADSVAKIAYSYDHEYPHGNDPREYAARVAWYAGDWKRDPERGTLSSIVRPDGDLVLTDSRSDATRPGFVLSELNRLAYEFCDSLRSGSAIYRHLASRQPGVQLSEHQVLDFLDSLVANRLMVSDGEYYLSLAIPVKSPQSRPARTRNGLAA